MARFRRFRRGGGRRARRLEWCSPGRTDAVLAAPGTGGYAICSSVDLSKFTDPTVVRIRGDIYLGLSSVGSDCFASITLGIGRFTAPFVAFDPGLAASADRDWMWVKQVGLALHSNSYPCGEGTLVSGSGSITCGPESTAAHHDGDHFQRIEVDIRAMRRIPTGEELALVFNWANVAGDADLRIQHLLRALVKE